MFTYSCRKAKSSYCYTR